MDVEKLIERLRNNNIENNCHDCALGYYAFEAATALSTLHAENEKLRAELERVTAERDAAVSDIENALAYGLKDCELCVNVQCYVRGGTKPCLPKWRGPKKED